MKLYAYNRDSNTQKVQLWKRGVERGKGGAEKVEVLLQHTEWEVVEVELLLVEAVLYALLGEPRLAAFVHAALDQPLRTLAARVLEHYARPPVRSRHQRAALRQLGQLLLQCHTLHV